MWRLDKAKNKEQIFLSMLTLVIMKECGTDPRTIKTNIEALLKLKWLKRGNRYTFTITGEHLQ